MTHLIFFRYELEAEISTVRNDYNIVIKQLDESKSDYELTEGETQLLTDKITEIEMRVQSYKQEIIEKETLIERLRILNNSNEQEVEKLKRDLDSCMTECKGYIAEIQKLNNEKADLDVELNHRNSVVMRLETQIESYKKNTDSKFKEIITTLEGDIEKLKREVANKNDECEGYIIEIERLNQEIFRLKEQLGTDPNRYHTEYVIGQKEQKVAQMIVSEPSISSSEVSRYEMSPKRMVTVRSPFEQTDEGSGKTNVTTTKYTRIQRSSSPLVKVKVDPSAEETITATSDDGSAVYTKKITKTYRSESPGGVKVRIDSPTTQVSEYRSQSGGGGTTSFQSISPYRVSVNTQGAGRGFEPVGGRLDEYTTKGIVLYTYQIR